MSFSLHDKQFLDEFSEKFLFNFYEKNKATKDSIKMKLQRLIYDPVKDVWLRFLAKNVNSWKKVPTNGVGKGAMVLPLSWNIAFAFEIFLEISFCLIVLDIQDIADLSISIISLFVL